MQSLLDTDYLAERRHVSETIFHFALLLRRAGWTDRHIKTQILRRRDWPIGYGGLLPEEVEGLIERLGLAAS